MGMERWQKYASVSPIAIFTAWFAVARPVDDVVVNTVFLFAICGSAFLWRRFSNRVKGTP